MIPVDQQYNIGKLPPQSVELEEAVLGALLLEDEAYERVCDVLQTGNAFYKPSHGIIYDAIKRLRLRGSPVDILLVVNELKSIGQLENCGGAYYISQLTNRTASASNIEFHARIIVQNHIKRLLITNSQRVLSLAHQDTADAFDLIAQMGIMQDEIDTIIGGTAHITNMAELAPGIMTRYNEREAAHSRKEMTGCPTGIEKLDEATNGWQDEDLVILAARPSMGKTAFMLHLAKKAVKSSRYVAMIFSAEMKRELLADRIFQGEALEVDPSAFRHGRMNAMEKEFASGTVESLKELKIYIDDTSGIKPSQIFSRVKRLQRMVATQMPGKKLIVFVDYIGLMESDEKHHNREDEIAKFSRQLKAIAKRSHVPVVALAQMNRQVESRGGTKRPMLSDLRDSGAIEQDADVVMFLHRPEYYGIMEGAGGESTKGVGEVIIAKQRNGPITHYPGEFAFFYNSTLTHITDPDAGSALQPNTEFEHFTSQVDSTTQSGETDDLPF